MPSGVSRKFPGAARLGPTARASRQCRLPGHPGPTQLPGRQCQLPRPKFMSKNHTFPVQRAGCAPERLTRRADVHQLSFFMVFQETLITSYFCQPRPAKKSSEYLRIVPGTFPAQLFSMTFQMDFGWFSDGFQFDFCWI